MRILLSGYYGFGNLGDEALLEVIVTQLRARYPSAELHVLSASPQATAAALGVQAVPRWDMRAVGAAVKNADVLLSGGGGLLQSATSLRSLLYYAGIVRTAVRAGKRVMVFAQSIGPLDFFGRAIVREWCKGIAAATVRDARSQRLLASLLPATAVTQTADPVFLYEAPRERVDLSGEGLEPGRPFAIVSVRRANGLRERYDAIARGVDRLAAAHGIRVAFLPIGGAADAEVSTEVIRRCTSAPVLLPECDLPRAASIIAQAHVVIGMRLHALILAASAGVPFLAIPYDPKVTALCEDLGYPLPPLFSLDPPGAKPAPAAIDAIVDRLCSERPALAEALVAAGAAVRAAAERNFEVLDQLIENPRG